MSASSGEQSQWVVVGARGWAYSSWSQHYYPHDLPEDWRLAYYANEFPAVLVPAGYMEAEEVGGPAQWYDDVSDAFRFFVELRWDWLDPAGRGDHPDWRRALQRLGERLGGAVLSLGEALPSPEVLVEGLAALDAQVPVHVDFGPGNTVPATYRSVLAERGEAACWHGGDPASAGGSVGLARIEDDRQSVRNLRDVMERFAAWSQPPGPAYLFLYGDPPGIQRLHEAATLRELMGL